MDTGDIILVSRLGTDASDQFIFPGSWDSKQTWSILMGNLFTFETQPFR